jgi:hypothetical protein
LLPDDAHGSKLSTIFDSLIKQSGTFIK